MTKTSSYLFIFGRTPSLSALELRARYPDFIAISERVAWVQNDLKHMTPAEEIGALGGTLKIAHAIGVVSKLTAETLFPFLQDEENHESHIDFGISLYGESDTVIPILKDLKQMLVAAGKTVRFFAPKEQNELSSVVLSKNRVLELVVVKNETGYIVGRTLAVQNFEEWGKRDYGRPYADAKTGMLPPKVARMMVNIAEGNIMLNEQSEKVLLDPFCGMGTILGEGLLSGWKVFGSDTNPETIQKAKKNIEWLQSLYPIIHKTQWELVVSDATHISSTLGSTYIDAVVTEPFMGSTQYADSHQIAPDITKIKGVMKGLEKLYIGSLRDWHKVLKPYGIIVMVFPEYHVGKRLFVVKNVIDMCENLGYTVLAGPIEYSRPQAVVKRKIYVLQKKSING